MNNSPSKTPSNKKIKLRLSENQTVVLSFPKLGNFKQIDLKTVLTAAVFLSWFALALSVLFSNSLTSQLLIILAIYSILIAFGFFLFWGNKYFLEPKGFMQVLVFALICIAGFLFAGNSSLNTFGIKPYVYLGGLFIMAFVAIFYVQSMLVAQLQIANNLNKLVWVAVCLVGFLSLFIPNLITLNVFVLPMLWFLLLVAPKKYKWALILAGFASFTSVIAFGNIATNKSFAAVVLFLSILLMWLILFLAERNFKIGLLSNLKSISKTWHKFVVGQESLANFLSRFYLLAIAVLTTVITVVWFVINKVDLVKVLLDILQNNINSVTRLASTSDLLLGVGLTRIYPTTVTIILNAAGLVGVVAYALLGSFAIYQAHSVYKNTKAKSDFALLLGLAIPSILAFFVQLNLSVVIWWWLLFILLGVKSIEVQPQGFLNAESVTNWHRLEKLIKPNLVKIVRLGVFVAAAVLLTLLLVVVLLQIK